MLTGNTRRRSPKQCTFAEGGGGVAVCGSDDGKVYLFNIDHHGGDILQTLDQELGTRWTIGLSEVAHFFFALGPISIQTVTVSSCYKSLAKGSNSAAVHLN